MGVLMDGAALAVEPLAWPSGRLESAMTPKADVQREIGELASELATNIAAQKEAHDRLRHTLDAVEAQLSVMSDTLSTLKADFQRIAEGPDVTKIKWSTGVTYSIIVTAFLIAGGVIGLYQSSEAKHQADQAAITRLSEKMESQEKVQAAEQRLRDYKEAVETQNLDRVEKLSQLNAAYITSLQRDQKR